MPLIPTLEAYHLLNNGCQGYMAFIVFQSRENAKLEEIPVVQEFPSGFPEELPGLRSERGVEFVIKLAPGAEPIFKTSYRLL